MLHSRWMPSIEKDGGDSMAELVTMSSRDVDLGPVYAGDAEIRLVRGARGGAGRPRASGDDRRLLAPGRSDVRRRHQARLDATRPIPSRRPHRDRCDRTGFRRDPDPARHVLRGPAAHGRDGHPRRRPSARAGAALEARLCREELRRARRGVGHAGARGAAAVPEAVDGGGRSRRSPSRCSRSAGGWTTRASSRS